MREAWFSHNGTMPLFLLFIVGIFLFRQFIILLTSVRDNELYLKAL